MSSGRLSSELERRSIMAGGPLGGGVACCFWRCWLPKYSALNSKRFFVLCNPKS